MALNADYGFSVDLMAIQSMNNRLTDEMPNDSNVNLREICIKIQNILNININWMPDAVCAEMTQLNAKDLIKRMDYWSSEQERLADLMKRTKKIFNKFYLADGICNDMYKIFSNMAKVIHSAIQQYAKITIGN